MGRCCCCRRRVSCFVCSSAQTPLSGAAPLFSSAPALLFRCAWKRRWCVSPAAGGTKSPPGPRWCEYRAIVGFVVFVVDRNKQGRCFTRASPPVASARVRSRPLASARLRSPPLASGHLRSTSLAKHILDGPVVDFYNHLRSVLKGFGLEQKTAPLRRRCSSAATAATQHSHAFGCSQQTTYSHAFGCSPLFSCSCVSSCLSQNQTSQ